MTVTVFGAEDELAALDAAGFDLGTTIEGPDTWRARHRRPPGRRQRREDSRRGRARQAASTPAPRGDIVVLRVDYFENYAGRFLSVEAKDGTAARPDVDHTGASLSLSWNTGAGTAIDQRRRGR